MAYQEAIYYNFVDGSTWSSFFELPPYNSCSVVRVSFGPATPFKFNLASFFSFYARVYMYSIYPFSL